MNRITLIKNSLLALLIVSLIITWFVAWPACIAALLLIAISEDGMP